MKIKAIKLLAVAAAFFTAVSSQAAPILFQGSTTPTAAVPMTPAEARAAWEAELQSFVIDDLTGVSGSPALTSSVGNVYTETGNGSSIFGTGSSIQGNRGGAPFIQFDVTFSSFVNAVGFDVFDNDGGGMDLLLTDAITGIVSTFSFTSTPGSNRTEFFGVVFDTSTFISALRVSGTDPGGITTWDNFTTGVGENVIVNPNDPTPVPAPASIFLFGIGLAAVAARRKKSSIV